jgi:pyruvate/2-oxoglutarate dehydrogenase complex dihydrolipoamide dehydrogenase (E3) component
LKTTSRKRDSFSHDVAVLGGGSAGYAAARTTAAAGLKTVVIEGARALGGLCILRGCMPSKALLYAAEVLHLARAANTWGLRIPKAGFNFRAVMARKDAMVEGFAHYRRQELGGGKFKLLRARGRFLDAHTLALSEIMGRAPKFLTAKYFVISTGSVVAPPPLRDLEDAGFLTSDEALDLPRLPKSLIVLGGGPVAVELAQFFCRFDVEVTLIQRGQHLLRDCDADAAIALEKAFRREGIRLFTNTKMLGAFRKGRGKGIIFEHRNQIKRAAAGEILLALGRNPATAGLGLEEIGVKTDCGRIATNAFMQTNLPHIYAAGDCTGPHQIVHIGVEQGGIAARNILHPGKKQSIDYRLLCSVVFTDPQVAVVGLTEKQAVEHNIAYLAASHPFNDHGKAMIMGTREGFVKLLAEPGTGGILGGACVGPMAGEMIHEIIAAMRGRMTVAELAAMPHYHPTLAEIWTYPAEELQTRLKQGFRRRSTKRSYCGLAKG